MKRTAPSGKHLLIADDDRLVLATLGRGLRAAGYSTREAASGEEALRLAAECAPDLALLDVRMPGVSGLEVARRLAAEGRVPFLFLSAYGDEEIVEQAAEHGALGYLVKPLDVAQVVPALEGLLAKQALPQ
jgi:response regulator NasT